MLKKTILSLAFLFFFLALKAQYTQIGNGAFASFFYGPMSTIDSTPYFNRHAYIYPAASMDNIVHGDTIRSLEFMRTGSDTLAGTAAFKIYLKNSSKADFGAAAINWKAEARDSGMQLVFNDHPRAYIGSSPGLVRFDFKPQDYFVFDTSGGAIHLQVLVEYTQQANQVNPIAWFNESSFSVSGFVSNNESKLLSGGGSNWNDSISTASTSIKPTLRINHPRHATNLEVRNIYALGRVPLRMRTADTIKSIVENIGLDTVFNHKVYLQVSGVNQYVDSVLIGSLAPYDQQLIRFNAYQPMSQGREVLTVLIDSDGDTTDNRATKDRLVNYNIYTHADPFQGNAGGIGFNGSTGDFVAKFYVNDSDYINQIKLDFSNSNRSFQLGIWEDDPSSGLPGLNIYTSDTLLSTAGTFILEVLPKVKVKESFYVGIRQTSNSNVAFSFQPEVPVRPDVFFFAAPLGDTNWVPFSPGFNFNFNIQPRIQVGNDLAIVQIVNPVDGSDILYSETDSLEPEVRVANYGDLNQTNAQVELKILNRFGQSVYTDSRIISLQADSQVNLSFKPFSLFNLGDFTAEASVDLNIDSVKDNNVLESNFTLYKDHDVAADIIFEPEQGDSFEINQDGFWPQVRVFNYGRQDQINFPVTARLRKDNQTLDSQQMIISLNGDESRIIVFDSIFPSKDGWLNFEVYTGLVRDSFPENDTARVGVYGKKSHDIAVLQIIKPKAEAKFATGTTFKPFFEYRNVGLKAQDSILLTTWITDDSSNVIYADSLWNSLNFFSTAQAIFKDFVLPLDPGSLRCFVEAWIQGDQDESNDTLSHAFEVVNGRDLAILAIDSPNMGQSIPVGSASFPVGFRLYNNGLIKAEDFNIELEIRDQNQHLVSRDSLWVESIEVDQTLSLQIGLLGFNQGGEYFIRLRNLWASEAELSENDTALGQYIVRFAKDLVADQLINPAHNELVQLNSQHYPTLKLSNGGFDSLGGSWRLAIEDEQAQLVYVDTLNHALLASDQSLEMSSTKVFVPKELGVYRFDAMQLSQDNNPTNDSISQRFEVIKSFDLSVDSALLPFVGQALLIKSTHQPVLYVSNKGLEAVDSNWQVHCSIRVNGNEIYSDVIDTSLAISQLAMLVFDSSLRFPDPANAEAVFWSTHPKDVEPENDTLRIAFIFSEKLSVIYRQDIGIKAYPNPFTHSLRIESQGIIERIEVYSTDVKLLQVLDANSTEVGFGSDLSSGTYFLKVYHSGQMAELTVIKVD